MRLLKVNNTAPKAWGSFLDELLNESWNKDTNWSASNKVPVNILETKDAYQLEVSAPGLKKDDINIAIDKDLLTISYEKKEQTNNEDQKTIRREFSFESFKRSFTLSDKVNAEAIEAKYEDGVLTVLVPKKEDVQPSTRLVSIS